jgi:small subunit ribosomal protein S8
MTTDPISDMLARLRNAALARHAHTAIPHSNVKERVADILKQEGYISDFRVEGETPRRIVVVMKYGRNRHCAFAGLRRTSRPGRRIYVGHREIPIVHNGLGVAILSTSHGVMTDKTAREKGVGGELLCEVW